LWQAGLTPDWWNDNLSLPLNTVTRSIFVTSIWRWTDPSSPNCWQNNTSSKNENKISACSFFPFFLSTSQNSHKWSKVLRE
jgi:hypothetical protein